VEVSEWLKGLGLDQYEATFRAHEIDADILTDLTEADLEKIGLPLGVRKRVMKAIAGLAANAPPPQRKLAPAPEPSGRSKSPHGDSAERRPITVMFCDLVGSTGLAARLDAEDWRNLVNAYLDEASAAVTGLSGHVLKKLGDGLMALFGYPQAQENDAERAVRAALAIQRALAELNARNARSGRPELSARIGLESGPVVVDATGEVFGEAPNVAARVQAAAEPGTVLVTATVQRQTAGLFVAEDKGAHDLKGVAKPVTLYRIVRASGGGRRGGARALTPFVGREDDLTLMMRRWERARGGQGQFVQIVGEPGIGKSRLMDEFHARLGETPHSWVEWSSSQLLQNTSLHPIAEWGRIRFGGPEVAPERRLAELEAALAQVKLDAWELVPLLAPLLEITTPEDRAPELAPEEFRRRQLAALVGWLLAGARAQPVVLAFEDLQWADPTSLELMKTLAERGAAAPLFIVATTRPEFRAPWATRSHHGVVSLVPLDRAQIREMVGAIAERHALSREAVEGVTDRTGGVPLFVEEVTRLLLEGGAQTIPPTLQQSLAARLDRLGDAREVAQIGAVVGREFSYALLQAVAGVDDRGAALSEGGYSDRALQSALERLADADLLFVDGVLPQATYRFKHALIQDAAYDSLLKSRRQALHRRAAEALRDANAEPETIAHHFTQAGLDDLAIEWWGKAGDQALRRSAFQEAIAHLGKAITMTEALAGALEKEKPGGKLRLQVAYGNAMILGRGYGARETSAVFERARDIATGVEDASERLSAQYGLWVGSFVRGELGAARELSAAMLRDCAGRPQSGEAGVAHRIAGATHWVAGEFVAARDQLEQALAIFDAERDRDLAFRFGQDVGVAALAFSALALWPLGEVGLAEERMKQMTARAAKSGHVGTAGYGLVNAAMVEIVGGNPDGAAPFVRSFIEIANEHQIATHMLYSVWFEGWLEWRSGNRDAGLSGMRDGRVRMAEAGWVYPVSLYETILAEAETEAGETDAALATIDRAIAESERTGQRWYEAESRRIRGDILLKRNPPDRAPAEEAYEAAIAVANQQGARSFGLRAALALAKLYQSTGRPLDAHAVLAPALEGFSPTPEMPEIADARALLAALTETDAVKAAEARRQRLTPLHVAYGNALLSARGSGAPETTQAFARAREWACGGKDAPERLAADYGLWVGGLTRGELPSMRSHAAAFLSDVEARPDSPEAGVAHRAAGTTCWCAGEYREARDHLERALALFQPGRDDDLAFRFGVDPGVAAMVYLAIASWPLGEVDRSVSLIDRMQTRMAGVAHAGTLALGRLHAALFEMTRGDHPRAASNALELARLAREHDLPLWRAYGVFLQGWAASHSGAVGSGLEHMRRGVEQLRELNYVSFDGLVKIALAEAEARAGDRDRAIAILEEALATSDRTGYRAFEAELHRTRGEMLLARDAANPTPAGEAFLSAIAVAKRQATRSFELRAALSLAKLYQSTGHPLDACAVLAPALEGFSATPEMPEIEKAQALLAALARM
jgi:class 3 adenylate cyclase/predicted ATPase